jgi:GNAT superfamily N-acetyltransferase
MTAELRVEELKPEHWPHLTTLFGSNGACGGCWCMWWRVERGGELWRKTQGGPARRAFKQRVQAGQALGVLAFDGEVPVGWCAFGPRADFPRVERMKAFRTDDTQGVWCVNCFFIARGHRGQGVARALLATAIEGCRRRGARAVEAYPVTTTEAGGKVAPAFAYTGPINIFEEQGFKVVQRLSPTRPLVRLPLVNRRASGGPARPHR